MRKKSKQIMYAEAGGIALLLACLTAVTPVMAQSQTPAEQATNGDQAGSAQVAGSNNDVADITVTGSRVNRPGFDAPTPTTVIDAGTLDVKSPRTMVETLSLLPAFRGTTTPGSGGSVAAGSGGGGFLNLRGLGTVRTLLLMDRQRLLPINANGEVDVSLLPTMLLSGVDVVTGGASASWGSDAVAGVVNFRLDSRYRGLTLDASTGISTYGDARSYKLGGKFGFGLGENVHVIGTVEHEENDGLTYTDARDRDYGRSDYGSFTNPNAPPPNAFLPYIYANETFGGLIVGGPLNNTQILPGGGLAPYVPCGPKSGNSYHCPTLRPDLPWTGYFTSLYSPLKRTSGFVRATWDISSNFSLYADALAGKSRTDSFTLPATSIVGSVGALTINRDNAYLPPELAAAMDANGLTSVSLRRYFRDQGPLAMQREAGILRGSVGLKGDLGNSWKLDIYASYGKSKLDAIFNNVTIAQNLKNAVDSVNIGGVPTCRINVDAISTNNDPACRPVNIFGDGAVLTTPDGLDYYTAQGFSKTRSHQFATAATISGEPFSTWAGPVSFAGGVEYRSYTTRIDVDAISAAKRFFAINAQPLPSSTINVKEAFGEFVVPLAKNAPLAENLELTAAGRITDYSTSGTVKTWKLGFNYAPVDTIRFRGTLSRDIRAPNINELFSLLTQTSGAFSVTDPIDNSNPIIRTLVGGNPSLKPEVATTKSFGAVFRPGFISGFQFSVDFYDIKVKDAITTPAVQQVINLCNAGSKDFCNFVYRDDVAGKATGTITRVDAAYVNLAEFKTRGLDFEANYRFALGNGTVNLNALANHTIKFVQETANVVLDSTGSQLNPKWTGDGNISYDLGDSNFFVGVTYRGGGRINPNVSDTLLANNRTDSVIYVNTAIGHSFRLDEKKLNLRLSINNLFNKAPPYGYPFVVAGGDNYDRIGRYFKITARYEM